MYQTPLRLGHICLHWTQQTELRQRCRVYTGDHPSSGGRGCHDWADQQRLHPAYDSAARFGDTSSVRSVPADFVVQRPHAYPGEELEVQSAQLLSDDHAATVERVGTPPAASLFNAFVPLRGDSTEPEALYTQAL